MGLHDSSGNGSSSVIGSKTLENFLVPSMVPDSDIYSQSLNIVLRLTELIM